MHTPALDEMGRRVVVAGAAMAKVETLNSFALEETEALCLRDNQVEVYSWQLTLPGVRHGRCVLRRWESQGGSHGRKQGGREGIGGNTRKRALGDEEACVGAEIAVKKAEAAHAPAPGRRIGDGTSQRSEPNG